MAPPTHYNELLANLPSALGRLSDAEPRPHSRAYWEWLASQPKTFLSKSRQDADLLFRRTGITFNVYGDDAGTERLIPFDLIPRIIPKAEWIRVEKGLIQRVTALNAFLQDIYSDQKILRARLIPRELVLGNKQYRRQMRGVRLPHYAWAHVAGVDLIRDEGGNFLALEDNLRVPSGVSYMIENRKVMMRLFPELFALNKVTPIEHYPDLLLKTLRSVSPRGVDNPAVVVLTPGVHNSAYFEHSFLAQQMGVELVEGQDLFIQGDHLYSKTTSGPRRIDVIYRRVDDDYLDPTCFRSDSVLGIPGLVDLVQRGGVTVCNAIGTGVADDKSIYPFVPQMIRFYLSEEPIIENVPTFLCRRKRDLSFVLSNLSSLVVKETHGSGGYGMLIGPKATKKQIQEFRSKLIDKPDRYIAQPTISLSTCPTMVAEGVAPRHVDLRPFVLSGQRVSVVSGGLTRVALKRGSLVVNSSQGGGTKDTWVIHA